MERQLIRRGGNPPADQHVNLGFFVEDDERSHNKSKKPFMAICCAVTAAAVVLCVVLFVCVLRGGVDKGVSTSGDDTRIEEDEKDASAAEEQDAEEDEEDAESEEDEAEASDDEEDIFYADERVDSILSAIEDAEARDADGNARYYECSAALVGYDKESCVILTAMLYLKFLLMADVLPPVWV